MIKNIEMGGPFNRYEKREIHTKFCPEYLEVVGRLWDLVVEGRTVLKYVFK
jgi:hypothetical protein